MLTLDEGKEKRLAEVVAATKGGGFVWSYPIAMHAFTSQGLVEAHPTLRSADGVVPVEDGQSGKQHAFRATEAGINHVDKQSTPINGATTVTTAPVPMNFVLEDGHTPSTAKRRGGARPEVYPFSAMAVGQSFFVPATDARPEPHKSLTSTVNTAMSRYAVIDPDGATRVNRKGASVAVTKRTRTFQLEKATKDGVAGARVFRTA